MSDFLALARSASIRRARRSKVDQAVIKRIQSDRPTKRAGRMVFYAAIAEELGVTTSAITTAMQRNKRLN